jgi:hypothetical protein
MPGDAVGGCLELILRFLAEILSPGVVAWIWWWMRATGACTVFLLTFGRVNLMERNDKLAGFVGIVVHIAMIALLICAVVSDSEAIA